ncbi:MAG: hypothetical protein ACI9P3_004987, partial [Bradyrhizobium sp.]
MSSPVVFQHVVASGLDEAAEADHVGGEDRSEPAYWSWHVHPNDLPGCLTGTQQIPRRRPSRRSGSAGAIGSTLAGGA